MKRSSFLVLGLVLFSCASAPNSSQLAPSVPPEACQSVCVSPFGQKLGASPEGVEAFSNCRPDCVYEKPSRWENQFAGLQWQCVEYGRRWLMKVRGLTFPSVEVAADLWKMENFARMDTGEKVPVKTVENGAAHLPHAGDILVYAREFLGTGHLAVVLSVDEKKNQIRLGEENYANLPWPAAYSRLVPFVREGGRFWLLDSYLLGWKALP